MGMNISFGQKIPVSQCQVFDKETNKFVNATLYEFDCKDKSDIQYFKKDMRKWVYINSFISEMLAKYRYYCKYRNFNCPEVQDALDELKFYSLEDSKNRIIGFCETTGTKDTQDIYYLETNREHRYKYAGQGILASIAKLMVKSVQNPQMSISNPANSARQFYIDKCGFKPLDKGLHIGKQGMTDFIRNFEGSTQNPIMDLSI